MKLRAVSRGKAGLTLIELLIALTIIGMTIIGSISLYGRLQMSAQINEQTAKIIGALRNAQVQSFSGIGNAAHGVYFEINPASADRFILYQGTNYAARTPDSDITGELPSSVALSLEFSTSTSEILFSRQTGIPNATGTIFLTLSGGDTRSISINRLGIIEEVE